MDACGHTRQSCHGFALASGGNQHCRFRRIVLKLVNINKGSLRNIDIAQFAGNINDGHHAAALYHYLAAVFISRIYHLLHTVYIGSKGSYDNPTAGMLGKDGVKGFSHAALRHGKTGSGSVGTVCHHGKNALFAQFRKALQIDGITEYRGIVDLKVACVKHNAYRRENRKSRSVLDAVVCLDKLYSETAQVYRLTVLHHTALGCL